MLRLVISHVVAIGAGLTAVTALEAKTGPVPPWMAFLAGSCVTLASMAQLRVRIDAGGERPDGDNPPPGRGRHRRR